MNLLPSIWSNYFSELSPEDTIKAFKSKGFRAMELSTEDGDALLARGNINKTAREFKSFCADNDFVVTQGHLKLKCSIIMDNPDELLKELADWIELYKEIGIKNMVLHAGEKKDVPTEKLIARSAYAVEKLVAPLIGSDVYMCLENLVINYTTSSDLKTLITASGGKNLGICLDTGHLNLQNGIESQYDFIKNSGSFLRAVHITDNESKYDQHLLPFSIAKDDSPDKYVTRVNFDEVMRGLAEVDYKGLLNYEIPGESNAPMPILLAKLDYVMAMSKYFLGLY